MHNKTNIKRCKKGATQAILIRTWVVRLVSPECSYFLVPVAAYGWFGGNGRFEYCSTSDGKLEGNTTHWLLYTRY